MQYLTATSVILWSNFIHQRVMERKKNKQKTVYNKHQNIIDMQDYEAYVANKIKCK